MPRITVKNPREFPNRKLKDFRGSPDQAEKLHPQNTIYVFHQATGGTIVMIDTGAPAPDPAPIYQEEPTPETCEYCNTPTNAPNFAYHFCPGRKTKPQAEPAPIETQPDQDQAPAKSLGSVLDNLTFKF
jgi:hypothetical protein